MQDDIEIIAHRGGSKRFPENTLSAIQEALMSGVDGIELDLRLTRDNEWVIFHDEFLDRTTNGTGRLKSYTSCQLKQLNISSWNNSNEQIPTLSEVVKLIKGKTTLWFDLKINEREIPMLRKLINTLNEHHLVPQSRLGSPSKNILKYLYGAYPEVQLVKLAIIPPANIQQWPFNVLSLHWSSSLFFPHLANHLHCNGKKLQVWYIDSPLMARILRGMGVDSIITNHYPRLLNKPSLINDNFQRVNSGNIILEQQNSKGQSQVQ